MVSKQNIVNPFFTGVQIPDDYFCDRKNETQTIIDLIQNGNNVVLKAQRRIGKSTLIHHIFNQSQIKSNYNTLYIDLFGTKDQNDFHLAFQNKLLNAPFAKTARIKQNFEVLQKGLHISLGEYNPVTGTYSLPGIGSTPSQIPLLPLEELFEYLEQTPKPNIVVFDEFQQVQYYPEKMAAIIRSFTQRMNNTKFIFSGSSKHMLTEMFQIANQPFYKSAEPFEIEPIPLQTYSGFCKLLFNKFNKDITDDAVEFLYFLFSGETAPMQATMNQVFSRTHIHGTADMEFVKQSIEALLDSRDNSFREILNRIDRANTRNTLFCIAAMGIANGLTSSKVMKYYHLDNASSVQKSLLALQDDKSPLIRRLTKGVYVIDDRFLELWIAREGDYLNVKYSSSKARFQKQKELEHPDFHPIAPDNP
jgi:AAA+ ATPase superfamily predicted ATPase